MGLLPSGSPDLPALLKAKKTYSALMGLGKGTPLMFVGVVVVVVVVNIIIILSSA